MKPGFLRTLGLLTALSAGLLIPAAHRALPVVPWLIVGMLFLVFLQTRFSRESVQKSHAVLLAANFAMGALGWLIGRILGGPQVALAGFFAGITPTAAAAPVIVSFLKGRTDYVVTAFMLSNLVISAMLPIMLPYVLGQPTPGLFGRVLLTMVILVFIPLATALTLRRLHPPASGWPKRLSTVSFCAWMVALFIITANASHFLRSQTGIPASQIVLIAGLSAGICAANFWIGRIIGGSDFPREASQSLGQKNTSLTIYVATMYANPLIALGPTCYVLWHNLWNSWQLYLARHRQ
jgi:bile acid:Na+ symporter, BASS family